MECEISENNPNDSGLPESTYIVTPSPVDLSSSICKPYFYDNLESLHIQLLPEPIYQPCKEANHNIFKENKAENEISDDFINEDLSIHFTKTQLSYNIEKEINSEELFLSDHESFKSQESLDKISLDVIETTDSKSDQETSDENFIKAAELNNFKSHESFDKIVNEDDEIKDYKSDQRTLDKIDDEDNEIKNAKSDQESFEKIVKTNKINDSKSDQESFDKIVNKENEIKDSKSDQESFDKVVEANKIKDSSDQESTIEKFVNEANKIKNSILEDQGGSLYKIANKSNEIKDYISDAESYCSIESQKFSNELNKDFTNSSKPEETKAVFIPKIPRGNFFMHDNRDSAESKDLEEEDEKLVKVNERLKSKMDNRWTHDLYDEYEQSTKKNQELIYKYGYDIREKGLKYNNRRNNNINNNKQQLASSQFPREDKNSQIGLKKSNTPLDTKTSNLKTVVSPSKIDKMQRGSSGNSPRIQQNLTQRDDIVGNDGYQQRQRYKRGEELVIGKEGGGKMRKATEGSSSHSNSKWDDSRDSKKLPLRSSTTRLRNDENWAPTTPSRDLKSNSTNDRRASLRQHGEYHRVDDRKDSFRVSRERLLSQSSDTGIGEKFYAAGTTTTATKKRAQSPRLLSPLKNNNNHSTRIELQQRSSQGYPNNRIADPRGFNRFEKPISSSLNTYNRTVAPTVTDSPYDGRHRHPPLPDNKNHFRDRQQQYAAPSLGGKRENLRVDENSLPLNNRYNHRPSNRYPREGDTTAADKSAASNSSFSSHQRKRDDGHHDVDAGKSHFEPHRKVGNSMTGTRDYYGSSKNVRQHDYDNNHLDRRREKTMYKNTYEADHDDRTTRNPGMESSEPEKTKSFEVEEDKRFNYYKYGYRGGGDTSSSIKGRDDRSSTIRNRQRGDCLDGKSSIPNTYYYQNEDRDGHDIVMTEEHAIKEGEKKGFNGAMKRGKNAIFRGESSVSKNLHIKGLSSSSSLVQSDTMMKFNNEGGGNVGFDNNSFHGITAAEGINFLSGILPAEPNQFNMLQHPNFINSLLLKYQLQQQNHGGTYSPLLPLPNLPLPLPPPQQHHSSTVLSPPPLLPSINASANNDKSLAATASMDDNGPGGNNTSNLLAVAAANTLNLSNLLYQAAAALPFPTMGTPPPPPQEYMYHPLSVVGSSNTAVIPLSSSSQIGGMGMSVAGSNTPLLIPPSHHHPQELLLRDASFLAANNMILHQQPLLGGGNNPILGMINQQFLGGGPPPSHHHHHIPVGAILANDLPTTGRGGGNTIINHNIDQDISSDTTTLKVFLPNNNIRGANLMSSQQQQQNFYHHEENDNLSFPFHQQHSSAMLPNYPPAETGNDEDTTATHNNFYYQHHHSHTHHNTTTRLLQQQQQEDEIAQFMNSPPPINNEEYGLEESLSSSSPPSRLHHHYNNNINHYHNNNNNGSSSGGGGGRKHTNSNSSFATTNNNNNFGNTENVNLGHINTNISSYYVSSSNNTHNRSNNITTHPSSSLTNEKKKNFHNNNNSSAGMSSKKQEELLQNKQATFKHGMAYYPPKDYQKLN